jgi:transcriptional regulator with GAF, ATPase, and Fis domain
MSPRTPAEAFAQAASALVHDHDVTDTLSRLLRDCAEMLHADALGVMVQAQPGELELLSATSHRAAALEVFQIQHDEGPCLDTIRTGKRANAESAEAIVETWAEVGPAIVKAGFHAVHAFPMRLTGKVIGGLNVFHVAEEPLDEEMTLVGQAFADVATLVVVQAASLTENQVVGRVHEALEGRTVVEQAKGVVAYTKNVDMAAAYDILVQMADVEGTDLTATARALMGQAERRG